MSILNLLAAIAATISQPTDPLEPLPSAPPQATAPAQIAAPTPSTVPVPRDWSAVFAAIRASQWSAAAAGIAALPASPLTAVAKAKLFTAKGSPKVGLDPLLDLLIAAPELPDADQLQAIAEARGANDTPDIAARSPMVSLGASPRRSRARAVTGEPEADRLRAELDPLVKIDDAATAEALLTARAPLLSLEARAEAAQRVAWAYYVRGNDADVRRIAASGRLGALGEWAGQNAWVEALAAWRQADYPAAARLFREVTNTIADPSLSAAAFYWAARGEMAARNPSAVAPLLTAAARQTETFYGMLARRSLGLTVGLIALPTVTDARVEALPNVRRATLLAGIGERDLAAQYLRHQSRIGRASDQLALVVLARRLGLPATQHFLAHFGPPGAQVPAAARYPRPDWSPPTGWRIDPALAFAHALQESSFRAEVVSPAGATGLMQVLPTTAAAIARSRGTTVGNLTDPATNIEYGQTWIEWIRRSPYTGGQLPKIVASYNAGPLPVGRWAVNDRGDPLLWIESIPYWETRFYVPTVLRNMWVYQGLAGGSTPTLTQLAEHKWPSFPERR